jgi:16S rRNA (uracil1498-N3)-methyltransferase
MSAARFFVDLDLVVGQQVPLPEPVAHHAVRVLRLRNDEDIVLFNGRGGEFDARLQIVGRQAAARVGHFRAVERESPLAVSLVQAWVTTEKLDWIVEKAVELGAVRIVLLPTERTVVRLHGERRDRRVAHLRQLAVAACEQCGRNRVPPIDAAEDLVAALSMVDAARRLILVPDATSPLMHAVTEPAATTRAAAEPSTASVALLVGPEGGFADREVARARTLGCQPSSLGPRVLRTETAGLAALAALQANVGDLRG